MGVASLVLGIISLVIAIFGSFMGWLGALLGIIGIVLGVQGQKNAETAGISKAGFICSIIGTVLNVLLFIACAACVGGLSTL